MKRVHFNFLQIELTRRCQLECAHCIRGNAQNIDMPKEVINRLLEQTKSIDRLTFTGGEPTLNLDGMRYILDCIKHNNIKIGMVEIVTNGILLSDEVIDVLRDYYTLVEKTNSQSKRYIIVLVSDDIYHTNCGANVSRAIDFYSKRLADLDKAYVDRNITGTAPVPLGKAKQLEEALSVGIEKIYKTYDSKIEVMMRGKPCFCPYLRHEKLESDDDIRILCPIYLTANGCITNMNYFEYEKMDAMASNSILNDDILNIIEQYNNGREYCINNRLYREKNRTTITLPDTAAYIQEFLKNYDDIETGSQEYIALVLNSIEKQNKINEEQSRISMEIAETYDLNAEDVMSTLERLNKYLFANHPELVKTHEQYPALTFQECADLQYYQVLYRKYSMSNVAMYKGIARDLKKKIDKLKSKKL